MKSTLLALETLFIALLSALVLTGCASHRPLQVAEHVTRDTLYLSNVKYDSVYINNVSYTDRTHDTLLIRETKTEYRYKLLRDTVFKVQHDSIPYEVRVVETQVERHIPWYAKLLSWIGALALILLLARLLLLFLRGKLSLF